MLAQGLAPATVNRRLTALRALMRKAMRWGVLQNVPQFDMAKLPAQRDRFLNDQEFDRIRQECPPHLQLLVTFLAGTGARLGEALDLTWHCVAPDYSSVMFTRTKSGRSRAVPLTNEVRALLQAMPRGGPDDRVFTYLGKAYSDPKTAWGKARKRAGMEHVTLHALRHFYASRLVRRGVSLYLCQRLLGHSSPVLTQRYAALGQADLARAVAVLDAG